MAQRYILMGDIIGSREYEAGQLLREFLGLIAFGAMKLGTRLHAEQGSEISNTNFLVGNLLSVLLAIVSSVVTEGIWQG